MNSVSTVWGLIAAVLFLSTWLVSIMVESLTAIITVLLAGVFSVIMALIARKHPRVRPQRPALPKPPAKPGGGPTRPTKPVRPQKVKPKKSPGKPRKRPPCSPRCRNSVRPRSECKCVCGGESHGSARMATP